jgi:hypothetical protein
MKLILESTDTSMLLERSALLQTRGIPTYLEEVPHPGVVPQHLYVLLEEHYADALALLEDDSHPVSNPVYADELEAASEQLRQADPQQRTRTLNRLALVCLAVLLLGLALVGARAWFT